jgi:hypothetical protein
MDETTVWWFVAGMVAIAVMTRIVRRKRRQSRESFDAWWFGGDPRRSLEDALNQYIAKYDVLIRGALDEPERISQMRTKLQLTQELVAHFPELAADPQVVSYLMGIRTAIQMFDMMEPEARNLHQQQPPPRKVPRHPPVEDGELVLNTSLRGDSRNRFTRGTAGLTIPQLRAHIARVAREMGDAAFADAVAYGGLSDDEVFRELERRYGPC